MQVAEGDDRVVNRLNIKSFVAKGNWKESTGR